MSDETGQWSVLEALQRFDGAGDGALAAILGPMVLVAHATEGGGPGGAWSYATVVAKQTSAAPRPGDFEELQKSTVYAVRKRNARFPGTIIVGRTSASDIWIDNQEVSKLHARIRLVKEAFFIEDAGSRNGTFVEGERIRKEASVNVGETIRFGTYAVTVYSVGGFAGHLKRLAAAKKLAKR